ncbi:MAG: hypothetical protein QW478_03295 [Candidatus Micrarchaeaceae archaeon]
MKEKRNSFLEILYRHFEKNPPDRPFIMMEEIEEIVNANQDWLNLYHKGFPITFQSIATILNSAAIVRVRQRLTSHGLNDKRRMVVPLKGLNEAFRKFLKKPPVQETINVQKIQESELRKSKEDYYKSLWAQSKSEMARLANLVSVYAHLEDPRPKPPEFLSVSSKTSKKNPVVFCTILSDTHFSEVVVPSHVNGVNAYNRKIALDRLHTYFSKIIEINKSYIAGIDLEGVVLCLGGDMLSGIIHEELRETNENHMIDEASFWAAEIASGISHIHKTLGVKIYIPAVVGNHGRMTKKPIYKYRVEDNLDYLLYLICQNHLKNESGITFDIAKSSEISFRVYDTTYVLCHGDEFKGGSGISGIYTPISLGRFRKLSRELSLNRSFDVMILGHFHRLLWGGNFIINGSLIGVNEYSYMKSLEYEPPRQACWLTAPRHGITFFAPIFVEKNS